MKKNETAIENRKFERVRKARDNKVNPTESDRPGRNPAADNGSCQEWRYGHGRDHDRRSGEGPLPGDEIPFRDRLRRMTGRWKTRWPRPRCQGWVFPTDDAGRRSYQRFRMTGVSASEDVLE